jgi:hypothetical protein
VKRTVLLSAVALAVMLVLAAPAMAQTFTVTNLGDSGTATPGDGSLRGEVRGANKHEGLDTIVFASGLTGTITFGISGIEIEEALDIEGPGPAQITIQQTVAHRVFGVEATPGEEVKIAGLHLADGIAPNSGGLAGRGGDVLDTSGSLTLENDLLSGGEAEIGGGVYSDTQPFIMRSSTVEGNSAEYEGGVSVGGPGGPWSIVDSTIEGNEAVGYVGGLGGGAEAGSTGLLEDSTIAGNTGVEGIGGAILNAKPGGSIVVRNSTITGNVTGGFTGGLGAYANAGASVAIEATTIAGNTAGEEGGGLELDGASGTLSVTDTIVAENTAADRPDVLAYPPAPTIDFSLIGEPTGSPFTESVPGSDVLGVSPRLEPLRANGGPTETMALPPGSPAVNKGGGGLTTDQRGDARPVIYPGVALSSAPGADGADIGAYELQAPPATGSPPPPPPPPPGPTVKTAPRVLLRCPNTARPGGCRFSLQIVSGKPRKVKGKGNRGHAKVIKPTPQSATATAKIGAGKSALVTLTPKAKFAAKLDAASTLLVRQVETVKGHKTTSYRRLKVVGQ